MSTRCADCGTMVSGEEYPHCRTCDPDPGAVFRIIDRQTGAAVGSYTRGNYDKYDFGTAGEARRANCHGIFEDRGKYAIAKYRVTYELIEGDVS